MSSNPPPIADPNELLGTYSFLPWLRSGIANAITAPAAGPRATLHVELQLSGPPVGGGAPLLQPVTQDIQLYGPGDIVGIDARAVVRTEPRHWVTNFESNYLAAVDFYDEDFPWRYTPAPAQGLQLLPWITLIVLSEDEFAEARNVAGRPLPFITITDLSVLPDPAELWAWAHVHFNQSLSANGSEVVSPDMNAVLPRVQAILAANPDLAYSRLLCPRRLDVNKGYHAFVVPTFETGRLAGLGLPPSHAPSALASAWATYAGQAEPQNFPYYYRWFFRTGDRGDFRYLVELIKPQPVDKSVGVRDFDVIYPGSGIPAITKDGLGGILRLGGALQVPDADLGPTDIVDRQKYEDWDQPYPDDFEKGLAKFINLPDDYAAMTPDAANAATDLGPLVVDDPDPLITSPLYGRWHALTQRLLNERNGNPVANPTNWVHRLNLDPRFRVPANFGTEVVEANAEDYMNYAWEQIGDVLNANQKIRRLHFATAASSRMFDRHLLTVAGEPQRVLSLTAPVSRRVLFSGTTVAALRTTTLIPPVLTSTAMRRVIRPGARLSRSLPFTATLTPGKLLERINSGEVTSAPPKTIPPGVPTADQAAQAAQPSGAPSWVLDLLKQYPWLPYAVLLLAIVLAIILLFVLGLAAMPVAAVLVAGGVYLFQRLRQWATAQVASQAISEAGQTPASVGNIPTSSNFVLTDPGSSFVPTIGGSDSPTATNFKSALTDLFRLTAGGSKAAQRPAPVPLDLTAVSATMITGVDPKRTIMRRGLASIALPAWIVAQIGLDFNEVMAYPKIDLPMYKPLSGTGVERLLPNINKIANNSITLMETNQRFIESYMVGLNHEFARKLLWREYPTDQRGSYFRQFWAVDNYIDSEGLSHDARQEKLYDIPEIHRWPLDSALGTHNNRAEPEHPTSSQAVLIVRGELLKKYPNTVIFAQHAMMVGDLRAPDWLTPAEEANPPRSKTRSPLFSANPVDGIFFFGFDLTIDEVKGVNGDPGWYFVLQERPGEARFGLELSREGADIHAFDELTWDDLAPTVAAGQSLHAGSLAHVVLVSPGTAAADADKLAQFNDDQKVNNNAAVSSARWADLLFRQPVMVAIHADEMLAENRP
ncbi:MAG: hypothetical protein ACXVZZ_09040 [Terriglobales bacterium]